MIALLVGALAIAMYLWGAARYARRFPARKLSHWRITSYIAGVAVMCGALLPVVDRIADRSFAAHMVQHIALMLVGPPLVLLGAPLLLLVGAPAAGAARRITAMAHSAAGQSLFAPVTGWILFVAVLWAAHFSPLYEAALQYPAVHVFEHVVFVGAAFLFWSAVVQTGYVPRPVPYPARMFYLFLAIPQGAFLGLAIYAARGVLYPHYLQMLSIGDALADQQNAGAVMWIGGGFLMFAAFMLTAAAWAAHERRPPSESSAG